MWTDIVAYYLLSTLQLYRGAIVAFDDSRSGRVIAWGEEI